MLNILFHIFSKKDQLNKFSIFLLVIFVEMSDKKKMLLPDSVWKSSLVWFFDPPGP